MGAIAATRARAIFDEEIVGRDFNTDPLSVDVAALGYGGDKYDFDVIPMFGVDAVGGELSVGYNNDLSTDYRMYYMDGVNSSAQAAVNDSRATMAPGHSSDTRPSLGLFKALGKSGNERTFLGLGTLSGSPTDQRIRVYSSYWKNTADPVESIQLKRAAAGNTATCHLVIFATPKDSAQEEWELIDTKTFVASAATQVFTGLNGDVDGQYKTTWDGDKEIGFTFNNNGGTDYIVQLLDNNGGALSSFNSTTNTSIQLARQARMVINAKSGSKRLCTTTSSQTVSSQQMERSFWYKETSSNIETIQVIPQAATTGTAHLYRKRTPNKTSDTLPWQTVKEVPISGDFSAGYLFDNLTGDSEFLYLIEWFGSCNDNIDYQINGSSGPDNTSQLLQGQGSNTGASSGSGISTAPFVLDSNGLESSSRLILYPKSGQQRPALVHSTQREDTIRFQANWYTETGTEVTSIKVLAGGTGATEGTLRLSKIPRIQP
jgi:hypothetical protein